MIFRNRVFPNLLQIFFTTVAKNQPDPDPRSSDLEIHPWQVRRKLQGYIEKNWWILDTSDMFFFFFGLHVFVWCLFTCQRKWLMFLNMSWWLLGDNPVLGLSLYPQKNVTFKYSFYLTYQAIRHPMELGHFCGRVPSLRAKTPCTFLGLQEGSAWSFPLHFWKHKTA